MDTTGSESKSRPIEVAVAADVGGLKLGVVTAHGLSIEPSSAPFMEWCAIQIAAVRAHGMAGGELRREAVRRMLRAGGFKPAGRNKPAQEYLLRTVTENETLPAILNAVDALNVISLQSGLPISLLAADRIGSRVLVRYGKSGERFVFNRSGQELELEGLICVCSTSEQLLGTPIKDSMQGKVTEQDRDVVAFIYAPSSVASDELSHWVQQLASAFRQTSPRAVTAHWLVASAASP